MRPLTKAQFVFSRRRLFQIAKERVAGTNMIRAFSVKVNEQNGASISLDQHTSPYFPKRVEESFLTVCIFVLYPSMKEDTSMDWKLSQSDRDGLQDRMQTTCDARECRRCSALLRLDQGLSVSAVAREFGVSRQTLHNWRDRFHDELSTGLKDQPRSGRPTDWSDRRVETLKKLLDDTPRQHGFHARGWTTSLLQTRLEQLLHWSVSDYSLRQQLHTLDYVWKRYRYKLKPDPLREKKKAHPQANQRLAARHGSLV